MRRCIVILTNGKKNTDQHKITENLALELQFFAILGGRVDGAIYAKNCNLRSEKVRVRKKLDAVNW